MTAELLLSFKKVGSFFNSLRRLRLSIRHDKMRGFHITDSKVAKQINGKLGGLNRIHQCRYTIGKINEAQKVHCFLLGIHGCRDDEYKAT